MTLRAERDNTLHAGLSSISINLGANWPLIRLRRLMKPGSALVLRSARLMTLPQALSEATCDFSCGLCRDYICLPLYTFSKTARPSVVGLFFRWHGLGHRRPRIFARASLARVELTMSLTLPSGSFSRYMPRHFASGTMPAGILGAGFEAREIGGLSVTSWANGR